MKFKKLIVGCLLLLWAIGSAYAERLVLRSATVFPSPTLAPIVLKDVLIEDGYIVGLVEGGVISDAKVVDLRGKFLAAGFWNSHVHYLFKDSDIRPENSVLLEAKLSDLFLRWGFVNTIDTGSYPGVLFPIHHAIESGKVVGPKIYRMGGSFVPKGGSPFYIAPTVLPEFESVTQAAELVRVALNTGLDGIKMFTGSWRTANTVVLMEPDHVRAAVTVAKAQGKLTFAHPSDSEGARIAIDAGVDVLAHAFPAELKGSWDQTLPEKMMQAGMSFIPTLKLFRHDLEQIGLPGALVDRIEQNAVDQLTAIHGAGCPVLFGTDVGYMLDMDTTREFELMARAGLGFEDILASLTLAPAKLMGVSNTQGKVKQGYQADLVVLGSDPRVDVAAFADVEMVIKGGRVIYQRTP